MTSSTDPDQADRTATRPGVLVAIDGSDNAQTALAWAAAEAQLREVPLTIVHCYHWPSSGLGAMEAVGFLMEALAAESADVLDRAAATVAGWASEIEVRTESVMGSPVPALVERSRDEQLVVVGSRGLGGFAGMMLGSVSTGVLAHALCPIVVVRSDRQPRQDDPVVVGIDGSEASTAALTEAMAFAQRRGCRVVVVHAWLGPEQALTGRRRAQAAESDYDEAWGDAVAAAVDDQLRPVRKHFPEVPVEIAISRGRATQALLHQAQGAQLLVLGTRGRGEIKSVILGSTSRAMAQHSPCPVMVVR